MAAAQKWQGASAHRKWGSKKKKQAHLLLPAFFEHLEGRIPVAAAVAATAAGVQVYTLADNASASTATVVASQTSGDPSANPPDNSDINSDPLMGSLLPLNPPPVVRALGRSRRSIHRAPGNRFQHRSACR